MSTSTDTTVEQPTPDYETRDEFELSAEEEAELAALEDGEGDDTDNGDHDGENTPAGEEIDPPAGEENPKPAETATPAEAVPAATEVPEVTPPVVEEDIPDFAALVTDIDSKIQEKRQRETEILGELETLAEQLDGGELGQGKYDTAKLRLERELRDIDAKVNQFENQKNTVNEQAENYQTKAQGDFEQRWKAEVNTFLEQPENAVFNTNPQVSDLFDKTLQGMQAGGLLVDLTMPQVLAAVRAQVAMRVQLPAPTPKAATTAKARKDPAIPPSLNQIPATETNGDDSGRFAYLDKLSGMAYEQALAKLSPEQAAEYERS